MRMKGILLPTALALGLSLGFAAQTQAKVVFTGYGDFRFTPYGEDVLSLSPAAQTALGIPETKVKERGFAIDSLGFFASTYFNDSMGFSTDITYRQIGY